MLSYGVKMNKILLIFLFLVNAAFAELINQYPSKELLDSNIKIIDIRTLPEWKETGLLKGAIPLTFFDVHGNYNIPAFMKALRSHIREGEQFAIICHVGTRTAMLADYLDKEQHMKVINLLGGIEHAKKEGLDIRPYKAK